MTPNALVAALTYKPGSIVALLDESEAQLVQGLRRSDIRAVVLVTPKPVPPVFRPPVVVVVERPLLASRVVEAIRRAFGTMAPPVGA